MERAEYPVRATLAGVLLFVIGMAIAGSTVVTERRAREQGGAWIEASGTVVEVLPAPSSGPPRLVVSFESPDGDIIRFRSTGRSSWRTPGVGATVPVIYPVGLPSEARIDPRSIRWTRLGIALGASLVLMGLGGYVAWYAQRRDTRRRSQDGRLQ